MISALTHSVWSMLSEYDRDIKNGLMSREEAQKEAIAKIKCLRFGKEDKDYFWINDMSPVMIMHPYNCELDGKSLFDIKDPDGNRLFIESVNTVKINGEGFISYSWQWKDDSTQIEPKISFVKEFVPWGWIIGTGVYLNDVEDEVHLIQRDLIKISLLIIIVITLLLLSILVYSINTEKKKKRTENELNEYKQDYKILIDNAPDAIVVYDFNLNRFVNVNLVAEKLFGDSIDKFRNFEPEKVFSSLPDDSRPVKNILKECLVRAIKGEQPVVELIVRNHLEKELYCEVRLVKLPSKKHRLIRASFLDITLRKQAEEALKKSESLLKELNNDKDRFLSILAHDLKSPFNILIGLTEVIAMNIHKYDIEKIELFINQINKSARNTYNLLEDLLMWARSQSGKLPFEPRNLNANAVCMDVVEEMKIVAGPKNISIRFFNDSEIIVFADVDMLKTVLRNLISNAIKFTHPGGKIDVSAKYMDSTIIISVTDNGIGIPLENMNKLFDISSSYSTTGTAKESGTGLGLLLCKEFVERHGGKIWVESKNGCDFKFSLPIAV